MIRSFSEGYQENMGGNLDVFQFAPMYYINRIPDSISEVISSAIEFVGSYNWLTGRSITDTLQFEEECDESTPGHPYKTRVTGFVPKLDATMLDLFRSMAETEHVLHITDNNGNIRIVGRKSCGMRFRYKQNSQMTPSGLAGFAFEFYMEHSRPSPFYQIS